MRLYHVAIFRPLRNRLSNARGSAGDDDGDNGWRSLHLSFPYTEGIAYTHAALRFVIVDGLLLLSCRFLSSPSRPSCSPERSLPFSLYTMDKHSSKDRSPSPGNRKISDEHAHHLDEANTFDDRFPDPDAGKSDEERALIVRMPAARVSVSY